MLNKQFDNAANIVKEIENSRTIQYRQLLSKIRLNNDVELGIKLLEVLPNFKQSNYATNAGLVYSALIDTYGLWPNYKQYF